MPSDPEVTAGPADPSPDLAAEIAELLRPAPRPSWRHAELASSIRDLGRDLDREAEAGS